MNACWVHSHRFWIVSDQSSQLRKHFGAVAWKLLRLPNTAWIPTAFHVKVHSKSHIKILTILMYQNSGVNNKCVFLCSALMLPAVPATQLQWHNLSAYSRSDLHFMLLSKYTWPWSGQKLQMRGLHWWAKAVRPSDGCQNHGVCAVLQISSRIIVDYCNTDTLTFLTNLHSHSHLRCTLVSKSTQYQLCNCWYDKSQVHSLAQMLWACQRMKRVCLSVNTRRHTLHNG